MNEPSSFDAQLRSILADGPAVAPASVLDGALEVVRGRGQRKPRFAPLDRQSWPSPRASIADPAAVRILRVVAILALIAALIAASLAVGARLREDSRDWVLEDAGSLEVIFNDPIGVGLHDGRLLVGGWASGDGRLLEVFDLKNRRSTPIRDDLPGLLSVQSATSLPDGRVLLLVWQHAERPADGRSFGLVFEPSTNTLGRVIDMVETRMAPGVAALADGRVLITGGFTDPESGLIRDSVEVFDPTSDTFIAAGRMKRGRSGHIMTSLADGRVLISGGIWSVPRLVAGASGPALADETTRVVDVDVFDPSTGTTSTLGPLPWMRTARPILLADGRVLIFGPETTRCGQHGNLPSEAFLADAVAGTLVRAPDVPHTPTTAVALPDGRALLAGQWQAARGGCPGAFEIDGWVAVYDPATGAFRQTLDPFTGEAGLPFDTDRNYRASVILQDGRVALIEENFETSAPNAVDIVDPP